MPKHDYYPDETRREQLDHLIRLQNLNNKYLKEIVELLGRPTLSERIWDWITAMVARLRLGLRRARARNPRG